MARTARANGAASRPAGSALDAVRFIGPHRHFDAVSGAEVGHEAGEVGLDGAEADVKFDGDLGLGSTVGNRDQDFLFSAGERCDGLRWRPSEALVGECREESDGDARGD